MEEYTNKPGERLDLPDPTVALKGRTVGGADFKVLGSVMQAVTITLPAGAGLVSEPGSLSWMTADMVMDTNMGGGGLMGALGRMATGESLFVVNYSCPNGGGSATFSHYRMRFAE